MRTIADAPGSALPPPPPPPPGTPTLARLSRSGLGRLRTAHAASLGRPGPPVPIPACRRPPSSGLAAPGVPIQPTLTSSPSPPPMPFTTTAAAAAAASSRPLRRSSHLPPPSPPPRALPPAGAAGQGHRLRRPPPPPRLLRPLPGFGHRPDTAGRAGGRRGAAGGGRAAYPASPAALAERGGLGLCLRARPDGRQRAGTRRA